MLVCKVAYQVATYRGEVIVTAPDDASDEEIEARARRQLRQQAGPLPLGYQSFRIIDRAQEPT